ncbi:MAG: hypothetical protein R2795_06755 [Saprospiraceae bacterium]
MLVAFKREAGVFDSAFLNQVHDFTLRARELPYVEATQSLTQFSYPLKTPLPLHNPAIHLQQPSRYETDKARILADERFVHNFINEDATTLLVYMKTASSMTLDASKEYINALNALIAEYDLPEVHKMGRPYFQKELVRMQQREIIMSAIVSGLLVSLVMWLLFRRTWGIIISLVSIGLGMLLFMENFGSNRTGTQRHFSPSLCLNDH